MIQHDKDKNFWSDESRHAPVKVEMKNWRQGFVGFPKSYIHYHSDLAKAGIEYLQTLGYLIHRSWQESDGWMDGMRTTYVIAESPKHELLKLVWHDSNSRGNWMQCYPSGGAGSWTP